MCVQKGSQEREESRRDSETQEDLHRKHRERMRRRFFQTGLDSFAEHEALELLLFFSIPRKNTNELAHKLIARFGSLPDVLSASRQDLMQIDGIGEGSAALLTLVPQICRKYRLMEAETTLNSSEKIGAYLLSLFDGAKAEKVYLLCLNQRSGLKRDSLFVQDGSLDRTDFDVRQMVRHAVLNSAVSVVLAHNHPSGLSLPSPSDYTATDRVREGMQAVGIHLLDHIIVAGRDYVSLRECGYL